MPLVVYDAFELVYAKVIAGDSCQRPGSTVDVSWQNDRSVGISYVDVTTGPLCLQHLGEAVVAGRGGVPSSGASAVTMNVTATETEGEGYVTVYPCDRARPTASNLNHERGRTVPNLVSVRLSTAGTVLTFASGRTGGVPPPVPPRSP